MIHTARRTRPGFTLVEILVAAALCLIIMVAMTYAFQQGMGAFSHAKSLGDLQSRLRTVETIFQTDLRADHLEGPTGTIRVSDIFKVDGSGNVTPPPPRGFFRITQESAVYLLPSLAVASQSSSNPTTSYSYQYEGQDADGIASTRAVDHVLHMTVRRRGTRTDELFAATVHNSITAPLRNPWANSVGFPASHANGLIPPGGTVYASEWAEVAYFLDTSRPTGLTATGLPTYTLVRRVRVLPDRPTGLDWASNNPMPGSVTGGTAGRLPDYQGMSYVPLTATTVADRGLLNDPTTVTNPRNRLGGLEGRRVWPSTGPLPAGGYEAANQFSALSPTQDAAGAFFGDDILLANVLSFEIKAEWNPTPGGGSPAVGSVSPQTADYPFDDLPPVTRNPNLTAVPKIIPPNVTPPAVPNVANRPRQMFDTWYSTNSVGGNDWFTNGVAESAPHIIRLRAIRIKVRVYDTKNHLTRQITIIQDL